jgi:NitT/TauT family transport system substrate-binding protein
MKKLFVALLVLASSAYAPLASAQDSLAVGGGPVAEVPQFAVANARNLWAAQGLKVAVTPFATGRDSFEALIGGQLDLAIMAEFPAVVGAMRDQKFDVVAVISRYNGNVIITKGDKPLASIADLAGKSVGVTVGTNNQFMLDEAVQQAGIKIVTVNVAPSDIVPALAGGNIAAAAPFPAFYAGAKRTLGAKYQVLKVPSYATTFILVATPDLVNKRPQDLAKFLRALIAGQKVVDSDPAAAQQAVAKTLGGASSLAVVRSNWKDYDFKIALDPALLDLMVREGKWIRATGIIKNAAPTKALFLSHIDAGSLKSVAPTLVTLNTP